MAGNLIRPVVRYARSASLKAERWPTSRTWTIKHQSFRRELSTRVKESDRIPLWYPIVGGFVITVAGGMQYLHSQLGGMEGVRRSASFYSVAIPSYAEYRYHMQRESPDDVWDDLDRKTSHIALQKMLELKGFYIKCGQMCAANIGNAFPKVWQETMSVLQDKVPHKDFPTVKRIVESEMGRSLFDVFASFEEEPIGSASIGQVHRATLQNGQRVVVKVMYPEVEALLRGDVRTVKLFAEVAQPVHVPALEEIEKQFVNEFDYVKEGHQLATVRENLRKAGLAGKEDSLCTIPKPYLNLTTKRVLVMEELKGDKFADALKKNLEMFAKHVGKTVDEILGEQDPDGGAAMPQGPTAKQYDLYISLLDSKRRIGNLWSAIHNYTVGLLPGVSAEPYEPKSVLPLNHARLVDDLIYIHGHEVLIDGYFNGDCHPGNILLLGTDTGKPQLGLIDYGQVKKLSNETRLLMCKLIIALAEDKKADAVRLLKEAGYKSKYMKEDVLYKYARVAFDEDNQEITGGLHIQLFMEAIEKADPIVQLPRELIMVSRTSILLRGLAHALRQDRSVAKLWKPIAERALRESVQ